MRELAARRRAIALQRLDAGKSAEEIGGKWRISTIRYLEEVERALSAMVLARNGSRDAEGTGNDAKVRKHINKIDGPRRVERRYEPSRRRRLGLGGVGGEWSAGEGTGLPSTIGLTGEKGLAGEGIETGEKGMIEEKRLTQKRRFKGEKRLTRLLMEKFGGADDRHELHGSEQEVASPAELAVPDGSRDVLNVADVAEALHHQASRPRVSARRLRRAIRGRAQEELMRTRHPQPKRESPAVENQITEGLSQPTPKIAAASNHPPVRPKISTRKLRNAYGRRAQEELMRTQAAQVSSGSLAVGDGMNEVLIPRAPSIPATFRKIGGDDFARNRRGRRLIHFKHPTFARSGGALPVRSVRLAVETRYRERLHEYLERRNRKMQSLGRYLTKRERGTLWEEMQLGSELDGLHAGSAAPLDDGDRRSMRGDERDDLVENVRAMFGIGGVDEESTSEHGESPDEYEKTARVSGKHRTSWHTSSI